MIEERKRYEKGDRPGLSNDAIRPEDRDREGFLPVGGPVDIPGGGEDLLVYAVGNEILCWTLDHRDPATVRLRPGTRSVIVTNQGVAPDRNDAPKPQTPRDGDHA